jgi:hypothetical protein
MGHPLYSKIKVCKKWFTDYIYKIWKIGGHITEISGEIWSYKKTIEKHDFKLALTLQRLVVNIIIK